MGVASLMYTKSLRAFEVNVTVAVAVVSQSHTFKSFHFQI